MKNKGRIAIIIILSVLASFLSMAWYKNIYEPEKRWEEHKKRIDEFWKWDAIHYLKAHIMHENYTEDKTAMSLFMNLTATYPFLHSQGNMLFDCVSVLVDNVTMENFNKTKVQYDLCFLLNEAVVENYSKYEQQIQPYWGDMEYTFSDFKDVAYFKNHPASENLKFSNVEALILYNYTVDLEHIKMKLDFIQGIMIKTGVFGE